MLQLWERAKWHSRGGRGKKAGSRGRAREQVTLNARLYCFLYVRVNSPWIEADTCFPSPREQRPRTETISFQVSFGTIRAKAESTTAHLFSALRNVEITQTRALLTEKLTPSCGKVGWTKELVGDCNVLLKEQISWNIFCVPARTKFLKGSVNAILSFKVDREENSPGRHISILIKIKICGCGRHVGCKWALFCPLFDMWSMYFYKTLQIYTRQVLQSVKVRVDFNLMLFIIPNYLATTNFKV